MKAFAVNCEVEEGKAYFSLGFDHKKERSLHLTHSEIMPSNVGDVIIDYDDNNRVVGVELIGFIYATEKKEAL